MECSALSGKPQDEVQRCEDCGPNGNWAETQCSRTRFGRDSGCERFLRRECVFRSLRRACAIDHREPGRRDQEGIADQSSGTSSGRSTSTCEALDAVSAVAKAIRSELTQPLGGEVTTVVGSYADANKAVTTAVKAEPPAVCTDTEGMPDPKGR